MWKGVPLGVVIFIVAGISYILIRVGITKYRIAQAGGSHYYKVAFHARWLIHLIHQPIVWAVLLISVAIGIWIVRARATHNPAGSVNSPELELFAEDGMDIDARLENWKEKIAG